MALSNWDTLAFDSEGNSGDEKYALRRNKDISLVGLLVLIPLLLILRFIYMLGYFYEWSRTRVNYFMGSHRSK